MFCLQGMSALHVDIIAVHPYVKLRKTEIVKKKKA